MGMIQAQIEDALRHSGQRIHPELISMTPDAVFRRLHADVYGEESDAVHTPRYVANDLSGLGAESFDGLFVFLVDYPDGQGLHWADSNLAAISHARFEAYAFDRLAQEYSYVLESVLKPRN